MYARGQSNKNIADFLKGQENNVITLADSSEPKSIEEIKSYKVNIIGAQKGAGSVNRGIDFVQDQKMSVTKRSTNTIKAYRNYMWKKDKQTEKFINIPDDSIHEWSNAMDATRYGLSLLSLAKKDDLDDYEKEVRRMARRDSENLM